MNPHSEIGRPSLPPIASEVDANLCDIDDRLDWLQAVSPLDTHGLWDSFRDSGYRHVPELRYRTVEADIHDLRHRLLDLPVEDVEHTELQALLWEKQRELDRQIELVGLRGTEGFLPASIDLFGDAETDLVRLAERVLKTVPLPDEDRERAGCGNIYEEAVRQIEDYRRRDPAFATSVFVVEDLSAKLMVSRGDLYVAEDVQVEAAQVPSLIHHEVGTHALTRHNGGRQAIRQLECGLAHYHSLQEGLGVLSEYLSGYLAPARIRVLAARVVATHAICQGRTMADVFDDLVESHAIEPGEAFNIALRVARGGGLTKDAGYLRGLHELLGYLQAGEPLDFLFVGKLALSQVHTLGDLEQEGLLRPPALLPSYLETPAAHERMKHCRTQTLIELVAGEQPA